MANNTKNTWHTVDFSNDAEMCKFLNYYKLKPGEFFPISRGSWIVLLYYAKTEYKKRFFYTSESL